MRSSLTALGLAGLWSLLAAAGALEPLERLTLEARYLLSPSREPAAPITIVAIDERALARYGQMPWDRRRFAELLTALAEAGVAVVGLDVAFDEPAREPAADRALEAALRRVPTVLPIFWAYADAGRQAWRAIEPQPRFARAAVGLGAASFATFNQPRVVEVEPYQDALARRMPTFATAVYGAYRGVPYAGQGGRGPWRAGAPDLIDFRVPVPAFEAVSAAEVLERPPAPARWRGRIALVGAVAAGLPDTNFAIADPRSGPAAGVEISAVVLDNMLSGGFLRRLAPGPAALLLGALALGPGAFALRARRPATRHGALLGVFSLWLLLAGLAFAEAGVWLEVVPVAGLLASCALGGDLAERAALSRSRAVLLKRYAADLASEAERQRARLEGELHDGLQQVMVAIGRELRRLGRGAVDEEQAARLERLTGYADEAQAEIKRLRGDLMPPALRDGGLVPALGALAAEIRAREGLAVAVLDEGWPALERERELALYWLVKEAFNNALKHAEASSLRLTLGREGATAVVEVADDGKGFVPPDRRRAPDGLEHSGLHRMGLRMGGIGGTARIDSAPGSGTRVRFSLPVSEGKEIA